MAPFQDPQFGEGLVSGVGWGPEPLPRRSVFGGPEKVIGGFMKLVLPGALL